MTRLIAIGFWADYQHPLWPDPRDLVDPGTDEGERREVADYLDRGIVIEVYRGWSHCRICGYDRNGRRRPFRWDLPVARGPCALRPGPSGPVAAQFTMHVATRLAELRAAGTSEEWCGQYSSGTCLVQLVTEDGAPPISMERWPAVTALICELQPRPGQSGLRAFRPARSGSLPMAGPRSPPASSQMSGG